MEYHCCSFAGQGAVNVRSLQRLQTEQARRTPATAELAISVDMGSANISVLNIVKVIYYLQNNT